MIKESLLKRFIDKQLIKLSEGLVKPQFTEAKPLEFMAQMRDGVKLKTHIFKPAETGAFPILFVRTPYVAENDFQRYIYQTVVKYGFIICYQECRGRGKSEGLWQPFENERNDGIDSVEWLKKQEFFNGSIVPMGYSYQAYAHLCYADVWDESIKAALLFMYGGNLYHLAYENGAFREEFFGIWSLKNNDVCVIENEISGKVFKKQSNLLPRKNLMKEIIGTDLEFYNNLISNPSIDNELWHTKYFMPDTSFIKVPLFLVSGWYDYTIKEVIKLFESLGEEVKDKSHLFIGPWTHISANLGDKKTAAQYEEGPMAYRKAVSWLLNHFSDKKDTANVSYYNYNKNCYEKFNNMPLMNYEILYPDNNFRLTKSVSGGNVTYEYNPDNPVITNGGGSAASGNFPKIINSRQCCMRQELQSRPDILEFIGESIDTEKTILGATVKLCVSSTAPDTCFTVKICALEDKKCYAFSYGITTLKINREKNETYIPGNKRILIIETSPVCYQLKKDSKIVMIISSSDYPSFNRHPNSDKLWCEAEEFNKAHQTIYLDSTELTLKLLKDND